MSGSLLINQANHTATLTTVVVPVIAPKKRGVVAIRAELCKGCGLCAASCPKHLLALSNKINILGYPAVQCTGTGCIGCGRCFYACPEPGAISIR